jgi:hypothetical protein
LDLSPHISDVGIEMRAKYGGEVVCDKIVDGFWVSEDGVVNVKAGEVNVFLAWAQTFEEKFRVFSCMSNLSKGGKFFRSTPTLKFLSKKMY